MIAPNPHQFHYFYRENHSWLKQFWFTPISSEKQLQHKTMATCIITHNIYMGLHVNTHEDTQL